MSESTQTPPPSDASADAAPGAPTGSRRGEVIAALQQNWRREQEGARTFRDLASRERDTERRAILRRLAEAEERHAAKWEAKLAELGAAPPALQLTWRDKLRAWVRRGLGTDAALRQMEADEDVDIARYEAHAQAVNDEDLAHLLREVRREEQSHGRIIRELIQPAGPQSMWM